MASGVPTQRLLDRGRPPPVPSPGAGSDCQRQSEHPPRPAPMSAAGSALTTPMSHATGVPHLREPAWLPCRAGCHSQSSGRGRAAKSCRSGRDATAASPIETGASASVRGDGRRRRRRASRTANRDLTTRAGAAGRRGTSGTVRPRQVTVVAEPPTCGLSLDTPRRYSALASIFRDLPGWPCARVFGPRDADFSMRV